MASDALSSMCDALAGRVVKIRNKKLTNKQVRRGDGHARKKSKGTRKNIFLDIQPAPSTVYLDCDIVFIIRINTSTFLLTLLLPVLELWLPQFHRQKLTKCPQIW